MTEAMPIDHPQKLTRSGKPDGRSREARAIRAGSLEQPLPKQDAASAAAEQAEIMKASQRSRTLASARTQTKEPVRTPARDGTYVGHNGEILTRNMKGGVDPYNIPQEIIPKGWSYQWNVVTVYNSKDVTMDQTNDMYQNGWRPVPAERHPGRWVPIGTKGEIILRGQRLEERPEEMTRDALLESYNMARRQMQDRNNSLMGSRADFQGNLPQGFELNKDAMTYKGRKTGMTIDREAAPKPSYDIAGPDE